MGRSLSHFMECDFSGSNYEVYDLWFCAHNVCSIIALKERLFCGSVRLFPVS